MNFFESPVASNAGWQVETKISYLISEVEA
ncbi:MAG: hypothetical protein QOJ41_2244 [Acidobacteriaceae bacterium]|jgi:hypothetical protein|nr:hypothetical protein [Acidobacteriaceae bacterium]